MKLWEGCCGRHIGGNGVGRNCSSRRSRESARRKERERESCGRDVVGGIKGVGGVGRDGSLRGTRESGK